MPSIVLPQMTFFDQLCKPFDWNFSLPGKKKGSCSYFKPQGWRRIKGQQWHVCSLSVVSEFDSREHGDTCLLLLSSRTLNQRQRWELFMAVHKAAIESPCLAGTHYLHCCMPLHFILAWTSRRTSQKPPVSVRPFFQHNVHVPQALKAFFHLLPIKASRCPPVVFVRPFQNIENT